MPSNILSIASQRISDGKLTVSFMDIEFKTVVVNGAKDKAALRKLFELLEEMRTGGGKVAGGEMEIRVYCIMLKFQRS